MVTFARVINSVAVDVQVASSATDLAARFHPDWLAAHPFVVVPDGTTHGAHDNGNGTFSNIPTPAPTPNNAGNPFFGKPKLTPSQFISMAAAALGITKWTRLTNDPAFQGVRDIIVNVSVVDADDRKGQFLALASYLQNTNGADGQPLMTASDITTVMTAWK